MTNENTRKYRCVTMAEYAHDLIVILNRMSTPRPFDAVDGYPIMYESVNTLIYYTDAIRIIINSPKTTFMLLCKKELNGLFSVLEQDICFITWRSQDYMFDIREYGVERKQTIQKYVSRIIYRLRLFEFAILVFHGLKTLLCKLTMLFICYLNKLTRQSFSVAQFISSVYLHFGKFLQP